MLFQNMRMRTIFTHGACTYFVDDLTYGEAIKHAGKVYGLKGLIRPSRRACKRMGRRGAS